MEMKEYLKMADVFCVAVEPRQLSGWKHQGSYIELKKIQEASAHAINSHDELVEMNKELLAALERFTVAQEEKRKATGRGSPAIARAITKLVMAEEAALAIISKAKGGAV